MKAVGIGLWNEETSGIYAITNRVNGNIYIGSATNLYKRYYEHRFYLDRGTHHNSHLQRSWHKYGESAFLFSALLYCNKTDLITFEQRAIDVFIDKLGRESIYNTSLTAGNTLGVKHSDETKAKIGEKSKGRWTGKHHTEETKMKIRASNIGRNKGKSPSVETRKRMSESGKGRVFSEEHKRKIGDKSRGRIVSDETREKIRRANIGRPVSQETRRKIGEKSTGGKIGRKFSDIARKNMSDGHVGHKISDETKIKMSEARIRYWKRIMDTAND